ncbi:Carbonic anhydrase or acetyltransferase, isoleucine patch superfamily [Fontimonas thermophila]|uniref:Carbonic anhydrase or acetyltransferase, isoleucine patch superfamily n=2 Tax=Fontimonas thermophila TaxID=1076937 RepID=A0A1I2HUT3_9GAMM|nr:gamma carbonic anhydrase family protein [Fontimonas thermophila]SFF33699.1 Carbonic anhydrase or acetyltransferase, isoleucine patch superfamily [Fontimonas thermophila]
MLYTLDGRQPQLGTDAWVADNAQVIGAVTLGRRASVWFNCVLRGDNDPIVIGDDSNVQDGSVLHTDEGIALTIGCGCTIGHMAMLHGCSVGDNSLIGIGAVVLNGARIGANSIVGARALVTEGKTFPDGVLILGAPAKVARALTDTEIQILRATAQHYVANAARYRRALQPVR